MSHIFEFNPDVYHHWSIRLKGYDYSQAGAYFVTICTQNRECLFGKILDGEIHLNNAGRMIKNVWDELPAFYPEVDVDAFQIMTDHVHGIIILHDLVEEAGPTLRGQPQGVAPTRSTRSLPDIVHRFKTLTTKRYIDSVKRNG